METWFQESWKLQRWQKQFLESGMDQKIISNGSWGLWDVSQKLNAMTMKNIYPLLLIPDILNKVSEAKAKYFTKLDIFWGYNNVHICEGYTTPITRISFQGWYWDNGNHNIDTLQYESS